MLAEIHCHPSPAGTDENQHAHVEAAIALVQKSGLKYEVGALGTTVEGDPDQVWALLRAMHEETMKSGAKSIISNIRVASRAGDESPRMDSLVAKFR